MSIVNGILTVLLWIIIGIYVFMVGVASLVVISTHKLWTKIVDYFKAKKEKVEK